MSPGRGDADNALFISLAPRDKIIGGKSGFTLKIAYVSMEAFRRPLKRLIKQGIITNQYHVS